MECIASTFKLLKFIQQYACDDSGYFRAELTVEEAGFTIGDRSFGFSNAAISLTRPAQGQPIQFSLAADFFGMENLHVASQFEFSNANPPLPPHFSATVTYTESVVRSIPSQRRRVAGKCVQEFEFFCTIK